MEIIIQPPSNPVAFYLFGIPVRWYGIILTFSIFLGIAFVYRLLIKKNMQNEADFFLDFVPYIVIFSIIGARLFYIIGQFEYYINNPKEIIMINHGGLSIFGAILFGILGLLLFTKKRNISFLKIADYISLAMPLCQSVGRWGNYFNQEAFGLPCDFFIKMYVSQNARPSVYQDFQYFQPTFLYEAFLDILIFIILLLFFNNKKFQKDGLMFCIYLMLYSIVRIIVEIIRIDSVLNIFGIPIAILISIFCFIFAFCCFVYIIRKN